MVILQCIPPENVDIQVSVCFSALDFFQLFTQNWNCGSHHPPVLHFLRELHQLYHFTLSPVRELPVSPHSCQHLSFLKNHYSHPNKTEVVSHCSSDLHCPGTNDVEHFFRVLADHFVHPWRSVHSSLLAIFELNSCFFCCCWVLKVKVKLLSHVRLFATPWTVALQAPPSMGFSRQEYWSGLPSPSVL